MDVNEKMAGFVSWVSGMDQKEIVDMVHEKLKEIKAECAKLPGKQKTAEGYSWDDALEINKGNDQWKHGGDCNFCRKQKYCGTECRANKLLKNIMTSFLYQKYLEASPEQMVKEVAAGMTPDEVLRMVGANA